MCGGGTRRGKRRGRVHWRSVFQTFDLNTKREEISGVFEGVEFRKIWERRDHDQQSTTVQASLCPSDVCRPVTTKRTPTSKPNYAP